MFLADMNRAQKPGLVVRLGHWRCLLGKEFYNRLSLSGYLVAVVRQSQCDMGSCKIDGGIHRKVLFSSKVFFERSSLRKQLNSLIIENEVFEPM